MTRLQCQVSGAVKLLIKQAAIKQELNLGRTYLYLVELAVENPRFPIADFDKDGISEFCALSLNKKEFDRMRPYREAHGLVHNSEFFKNALERGLSVHLSSAPDPA